MSENSLILNAIEGEELTSVEFVQDYVQLHFNRPSIIAYTWPVLEARGETYCFGDADYRNMLCDRITRKVQTASIVVDEALKIEFDDGVVLSVSLRSEDRTGPEAVLYCAGSSPRDPILEF